LDQRVTERIQKLKTVLSAGQIRDLKTRCKAAQNKLKTIKKVAAVYSSTQNKQVDTILSNADRLSGSLKNQGIDASPIDQKIEEINSLKTQIDSTYENYLLAIDDSAIIDCKVGPEGFRSSVDDAKNQFSELADLRKSLKDLIKIELRKTLIDLKDGL
jgi:protein subunit release factor A